jgi:hypothetical protein
MRDTTPNNENYMSEANPYQSPQTEGAIVPTPWISYWWVFFALQIGFGIAMGILGYLNAIYGYIPPHRYLELEFFIASLSCGAIGIICAIKNALGENK